jgi:Mg2+/Co2+ transporter CorC
MDYDIEWINTTHPSVEYGYEGIEDPIETLTERFEAEFHVKDGDDIGGLIVYSNKIVYDYENFCGWVKL